MHGGSKKKKGNTMNAMNREEEAQTQVIYGVCPSKSNGYRVITIGGHGSICKTKNLTDYEKSFYLQCDKYRNAMIDGFFSIDVKAYFPSNRNDLDGIFKVLLDCLQHNKAIKNDNNCVCITARKFVSKENPRIEFTIRKENN